MNETLLKEIQSIVQSSKKIVFLGGAGVSTASGIPDFRSPSGLYKMKSKYGVPYEVMLSHTYFEYFPEKFYDFYWSGMVYKDAKPNRAHYALAQYEKDGGDISIVTQNIDGLHQEAGSKKVYEVHGSTKRYFCTMCGRKYALKDLSMHGVPKCPCCHEIIKPDVVLYEEPLDDEIIAKAILDTTKADLLIVGGTSLNVYPIANLPSYFYGKHSILINLEATPKDKEFEYVIHEDIGEVLSKILVKAS